MDHELKHKLHSITQELDVASHVVKIAELKTQHTHSITAIPSELNEPLEEYNCVMFALDLVGRLEDPCRPFGRFYADTEFLSVLIAKGILKEAANEVGKIIVWSDDEKIKHVGLVSNKDVAKSKWGVGNLYEHGYQEVPESYGSNLTFFEPINGGLVLEMLTRNLARKL